MSSRRPYTIAVAFFLTLATVFFFLALARQYQPQLPSGAELKNILSAYKHGGGDKAVQDDQSHKDLILAEKLWQESIQHRERMYTQLFGKDPSKKIQDFIYPYNVWDLLRPTFFCPFDIERVGKLGDGGKWVCGMSKYEALSPGPSMEANQNPMIAYSFGVEHDSSFEAAFLERLNVDIWGFDFSVEDFAHEVPTPNARAHFTKAAISGTTDKAATPPRLAVHDIMKDNGHTFVDVMKMDIESAEFEALTAFMDATEQAGEKTLPVGQLLLEIHLTKKGPQTTKEFMDWFHRLETMGLRPAWNEHNWIGDVGSGHPQFIEVSSLRPPVKILSDC